MPESPLTLAQQLAICQQVARLVRRQLPIAGELAAASSPQAGPQQALAQELDAQLQSGKSLAATLAGDPSRDSQMLSACIQVGEQSGQLAQTLEAWTELHLACARYGQALRGALVYPALLILVTLASLGYIVWHLIPEYQVTYSMFGAKPPDWLAWLIWIRLQLGWLLALLVALALTPLIIWYMRRRSLDAHGLPRETAQRLRVQVLGSQILGCGVGAGVALNTLISDAVRASCGNAQAASQAFSLVQQQRLVPQLARETTLIVTSLYAGLLTPTETVQHLNQVADTLRQQADDHAAAAVRWLPMLVALTIGALTVLTYVVLIYLPWIALLMRIIEAEPS